MRNRGWMLLAWILLVAVGAGCAGKSPELASGIIYVRQENYEKAIEMLKKAIEVDPTSWEAHYQLAVAYSEIQRYSEAYPHFQKAEELAPGKAGDVNERHYAYWYDHFAVGETARKAKEYATAEKEFLAAVEIDPQRLEAYSNLAFTYHKMGEIERSLAMYEKVVEIDPDNADALQAMAAVQRDLKRYGEAVEALNRLLAVDPERKATHLDIAECYRQLGDNENALKAYQEALEAVPNEPTVPFQMAVIYYKDGNYADAATYFLKAAEASEPSGDLHADALYNRAQMQVQLEDFEGAKETMLRLIEVRPDVPEYYDLLGRIYFALGDQEKGMEMFEKAKSLEDKSG